VRVRPARRFYRFVVDLSGIIFVLLAIVWALYLIPKALRHHDEVARTRAIDRFSDSTRVLARREPVSDRDARLVVRPAASRVSAAAAPAAAPAAGGTAAPAADERPAGSRAEAPAAKTGSRLLRRHRRRDARAPRPAGPDRRPAASDRRPAARAAARRRRRILAFLLLCDLAVAAVAYLGRAPWWSVAVPAVLTVLFLVLCRTQVRRAPARIPASRRPIEEPDPVDETSPVTVEPVGQCGEATFDDEEDTVGVPVAELQAALAAPAAPGGSLWDPLPMTLPTYVTKPAARRTVRTIDLGEPGTWTSGRTEEDARIAAQASEQAAPEHPEQRAVGS
jgi:membrane protein YdbS with pleckstrin-like domain